MGYEIVDELSKRAVSGDPECGPDFAFDGVAVLEDIFDGERLEAEDVPFFFCSAEFCSELFGFPVEVDEFLHGDWAEIFQFFG